METNGYLSNRRRRRGTVGLKRLLKALRAVLVSAIAILAVYLFSQSPLFALQDIEGRGLRQLSLPEITRLSGLNLGMNLFQIDTAQVQRRLLKDPLIAQAEVKRRFPHTVIITIKERQPCALFLAGETLLVIDRQGYILDQSTTDRPYNLPIITGPKAVTTRPGQKVCQDRELGNVLTALDSQTQVFFSEFHIAGRDQLVAYSRDGIPVLLGSPEQLKQKLQTAITFLGSLDTSVPVSYVDIRAVNAPAVKYAQRAGNRGENLYNPN